MERISVRERKVEKDSDPGVSFEKLVYANGTAATHLSPISSVVCFGSCLKGNPKATFIEIIFQKPVKADQQNRPITWIELYTLYRCMGYPKPLDDLSSPGLKKHTILKQMREFKRFMRATTGRILAEEGEQGWFKQGRETPCNLAAVGIAGKHNTLSCNVHVQDEVAEQIAKHPVRINTKVLKNKSTHLLSRARSCPLG